MGRPQLGGTAQSSTDSTQEAYFHSTGQPAPRRLRQRSVDGAELGGGRTSRTGYYHQHSNSAERGARTPGDFVQDTHGRSWRPSIAVQVDSSETHSESDAESKALRAMQSIGVQVEDKRRERFRRSCSVMAGVQAELEREEHRGRGVASSHGSAPFQRHASEPEESCTIHTQGQWGYHDNYHHANNPRHAHANTPGQGHARAPMPGHDPEQGWASEGSHSLPGSARSSPFPRDGEFYLRMLHTEVERMERWCQRFEREAEEKDLPEEALTRIRSAVGNAQIFMSQKVQQFFRLCQQSLDPTAHPQPSPQDLAELWDLLQLAVEEVRLNFQELQRLKDSGWRLYPKDDKTLPPPLPKKPSGGVGAGRARGGAGGGPDPRGGVSRSEAPPLPAREKSVDLGTDSQDPHGRLLQAKRAAHSFRQNSATESADSIEIYIPEAQTRF
ncbi:hypothetical protein AGOR_G00101290 [Albula goreensis]|uniref:Disks large-associated protein 3 n=1 Tax=Albula goreensis TaxID=1534307 RepID=A0A8T3DCL0_9TELE|nr:hypothetical protein AGOR_G00101290 [Albula goreensis]